MECVDSIFRPGLYSDLTHLTAALAISATVNVIFGRQQEGFQRGQFGVELQIHLALVRMRPQLVYSLIA